MPHNFQLAHAVLLKYTFEQEDISYHYYADEADKSDEICLQGKYYYIVT